MADSWPFFAANMNVVVVGLHDAILPYALYRRTSPLIISQLKPTKQHVLLIHFTT